MIRVPPGTWQRNRSRKEKGTFLHGPFQLGPTQSEEKGREWEGADVRESFSVETAWGGLEQGSDSPALREGISRMTEHRGSAQVGWRDAGGPGSCHSALPPPHICKRGRWAEWKKAEPPPSKGKGPRGPSQQC